MGDAKWLSDQILHKRLVATGEKVAQLRTKPDKWDCTDKAWKQIDVIVSKVYTYLADEFDDAPEEVLYAKLLCLLREYLDEDARVFTHEGLVLLTTRAQNTAQLIREYQRLVADDQTKVIEEQHRLDFYRAFTPDKKRGVILKALGEELRARGVTRMVRE